MATAPTFTSTDVRDFLNANPQLTDADIADLMDAYGVSKQTVQEATGVPLSEVEARYAAAASPEITGTAQDFINQIDTSSGYTRTPTKVNPYSDIEQGFMDWLGSKSDWTDKDIANYIAANKVPLEFVANYTGLPYSQVLDRYTTAATTTLPGQTPTVPGVTLGQGFVRPEYTQRDFSMARATPRVVVPTTYADRALLGPGAPGASAGVFGLPGALMPVAYPGVPAAAARPAENVAPVVVEGEGMKGGGIASLANKGRYGDTMLAHISPEEAGILRALGGSGTINPRTGLPEFWNPLKQIRKFGDDVLGIDDTGGIAGTASKIAKALGPIGTIAAAYFGGPIGAGIMSGLQGGKDGKVFDFKRGAKAAALAYGLQQIGEASGLGDTAPGASSSASSTASEVANIADAGLDPNSLQTMADQIAVNSATQAPSFVDTITSADTYRNLASDVANYDYASLPGKAVDYAVENPMKTAFVATQAPALYQGYKEKQKMDREQAGLQAAYEDKKRRSREFAEEVMRRYPIRFAAGGGMMYDDNPGMDGMKAGGLREGSFVVPADVVAHLGNGSTDAGLAALSKKYAAKPVKGRGDGMSDSIPTTIEGRQRARVADGEAVIPPEVVKKVQPKRLYQMMDNVRKARTGTTKQGKQINPAQYMPA